MALVDRVNTPAPSVPLAQDMLAEHLQRRFGEVALTNEARRREADHADRWPEERERLLTAYRRMLGDFPERTPLNARVTGRLERASYAIERLIFESRPGLLVTANLYVPKGITRGERRPAVLVPCGHSENGKAAETYQRLCIGLATRGYVVLIYDPLGQGERQLYWNPELGRSELGGNTTQHSFAGNQCFLLGINLAQYMVWDSIRALDYLCARPEVEPERIGMAGNSGGGTNTAQTAPLDERIKAAAICCYITTMEWRRRAWSTGDAEQNLHGQLPEGLDLADFVRLIAPRPVLVGSAALDFFPLEGAQESVGIARRLYEALGAPDRLEHAVGEGPHGYSAQLRRATYRHMDRWLGVDGGNGVAEGDRVDGVAVGSDGSGSGSGETDVMVEADGDLQCTPDGQVALLGSKDVFTLNREHLTGQDAPRSREVRRASQALTEYESPADRPPARPAEARLFSLEGVRRHETVTLWPEPDVAVPGSVFTWRAHTDGRRAVLWLDGQGAHTALGRPAFRTLLQRQAELNWLVAAVDVRGVGETAPRSNGREPEWLKGAEAFLAYECIVLGRPLLGMRVRDAACAVDYLLARQDVDAAQGVTVIGWGAGGLLALHLAALDERVTAAATVGTLARYRSLLEHERYAHPAGNMVSGSAGPEGYDLDSLERLIAPRPLLRLRSVDHLAQPLTGETDDEVNTQLVEWMC